jgi:hypothetical protein
VQAEVLRPADYDSGWMAMDHDTPYLRVDHGMGLSVLAGQVRVITRSVDQGNSYFVSFCFFFSRTLSLSLSLPHPIYHRHLSTYLHGYFY